MNIEMNFMKNRIKNKIWYFLPTLLILIYARPVDAIMWELTDGEWNFIFTALIIFVIFFVCILLLKLILDEFVLFVIRKLRFNKNNKRK